MIVAPVADAATLLPPILPPDPAEATTLEPASVVELARDASVVLLIFPVYDPSSSCLPLLSLIHIYQCFGQNEDLQDKAGKFDIETGKIVLRDSKVTQRLFLHEDVYKRQV